MNDDLMTRAQQALAKEEEARLLAKMRELEAADRAAETQAERTARQDRARAEAAEIMAQEPRSLVTDQFDAAVSALAVLVEAIHARNDAIKRSNNILRAARCYEANAGNEAVSIGGETHGAAEAPAHVMVARVAQAVAAKFRDRTPEFQQLTSTLNGIAGPEYRKTQIGR